MAICRAPGCTVHYACTLRAKGVSVSPAATPTRRNTNPTKAFAPANSWERGVAGERRPDGSFMPLLDHNRERMGVKEASERRHQIGTQLDRLKNDPTIFRSERT